VENKGKTLTSPSWILIIISIFLKRLGKKDMQILVASFFRYNEQIINIDKISYNKHQKDA